MHTYSVCEALWCNLEQKQKALKKRNLKGRSLWAHRQGFCQQDTLLGGLNVGNRHSFAFSKRCTFLTCKGNC